MEGPSKAVHESVHEKMQEGMYRLWIMVAQKKMGTKLQRSGRAHAALDIGHLRQDQRMKDIDIRTITS